MHIDASNHPNDANGYSVYAGVLFTPPALTAAVGKIHAVAASPRATLPAHVTVMGTFCDVPALDRAKDAFTAAVKGRAPVSVEFSEPGFREFPAWAGVMVAKTTYLVELYESLTSTLSPLVTNAYAYDVGGYMPHMTLWQECPPQNLPAARKAAEAFRHDGRFVAGAVALVGRRGAAYGGRWETVASFPLQGGL